MAAEPNVEVWDPPRRSPRRRQLRPPWLAQADRSVTEALKEPHGLFANITLLFMAIHVAGVAAEGPGQREKLVRAVIDSGKRSRRAALPLDPRSRVHASS